MLRKEIYEILSQEQEDGEADWAHLQLVQLQDLVRLLRQLERWQSKRALTSMQ
ncbi:hypothetical protein B4113_1081 [Geobacillus sp. B4113_201601]|nr:hypothetical protein B4113_1081 [Geobacillus sp. B4113_201601]